MADPNKVDPIHQVVITDIFSFVDGGFAFTNSSLFMVLTVGLIVLAVLVGHDQHPAWGDPQRLPAHVSNDLGEPVRAPPVLRIPSARVTSEATAKPGLFHKPRTASLMS